MKETALPSGLLAALPQRSLLEAIHSPPAFTLSRADRLPFPPIKELAEQRFAILAPLAVVPGLPVEKLAKRLEVLALSDIFWACGAAATGAGLL